MIFVAQQIFSQNIQQKNGAVLSLTSSLKPAPIKLLLNKQGIQLPLPRPFLAPDYYSTQLGFFCKQEIKFEKVSKIPFKFRLGSVDECDRLEGKRRIN